METQTIVCPSCGSTRLYKAGTRGKALGGSTTEEKCAICLNFRFPGCPRPDWKNQNRNTNAVSYPCFALLDHKHTISKEAS